MAEDRALPEDHQAAGHDVGAFDRDRDRDRLPVAAGVVARAEDDALAAVDVHHVAGDFTAHLGAVVLGDGGRHRGVLAARHGSGGGFAQRTAGIGIAGDPRQRFFHALEAADRQAELLADARIAAHRDRAHLRAAAGGGGQGDRTACLLYTSSCV